MLFLRQFFGLLILFLITGFFIIHTVVFAEEFSSGNYKVLDPVINPSEYSTSANFQLWGTMSQNAVGESASSGYDINAGFLYFPFASSPSLATTPGNGQVSLSWTSSSGYLGWNPSGYNVARSTTSGGPYTYTSLGNVNSNIQTGLSNGTTYYFVIAVKDVFGNIIASSTEVFATPVSPPASGGGGGGGSDTGVIFSGRAYPLSQVNILKDGQLVLSTIAGPDSNFIATLNGLSAGNYTFGVYGVDKSQIKSNVFTFPIYITYGVTTRISGIFIAPTIAVDKSEVKRGDNIAIFGQSAPDSEVTINVNSEEEFFIKKSTDNDGVYLLNFDTSVLELGKHSTKSKATKGEEVSDFSNTVGFLVGNKNVPFNQQCASKGDLNGDCRVNLVDFSIAAYWYKKPLTENFRIRESERLNADGKVDLVDFSIMAYYWTG